ncbi:hypothetical protein [Paracoccus sp. (in: a-proteobacteria)]|uniref:hypothetical protein n=1 Tax=Paracoccus sp. TaxID=267 RepID=UPI002897AE8F|nr:hypothetical protein [Paracoccus sp. (in: a-proteobacteria)]
MTRIILSLTYLVCLMLMIFVGVTYETISTGLASPGPDGPFFCKELLSSGSDDDAMMSAFSVFLLPLALRTVRITRIIAAFEVAVFYCCGAMTFLALGLASMDCASILYTAFILPDLLLAGALLALPVSAITLSTLRVTQ